MAIFFGGGGFHTEIQAEVLYKVLKGLGKVQKTFRVEETRTITDSISGKSSTKKIHHSQHAPILVSAGEFNSVIIDCDKLRDFTKKLRRTVLDVRITRNHSLTVRYEGGDLVLQHLNATPGAELDLKSLEVIQTKGAV